MAWELKRGEKSTTTFELACDNLPNLPSPAQKMLRRCSDKMYKFIREVANNWSHWRLMSIWMVDLAHCRTEWVQLGRGKLNPS